MTRPRIWSLVLTTLAASLMLGGCQSMGTGETVAGPYSRYLQYLSGDIPERYAHRRNPLPDSAENIAAGAGLYRDRCLACHGATGRGDGPAGTSLAPPPVNLAFTRVTPVGTDRFFFWTISEGGGHLGTAMPPFSGTLRETEIWQIVHHVQAGLAPLAVTKR